MSFEIRELSVSDREWVARLLAEHWGAARIVTRGQIYDADILPGFAAVQDGEPIGLLTYRLAGQECEIISLNSLIEGIGVGSALIQAVQKAATAGGCKRLWLITTNDNLKAIRFYQKRGFSLVAVHRHALEQSRRLKPQIPLVGIDGIPLRDEIELEMIL